METAGIISTILGLNGNCWNHFYHTWSISNLNKETDLEI